MNAVSKSAGFGHLGDVRVQAASEGPHLTLIIGHYSFLIEEHRALGAVKPRAGQTRVGNLK
jgi:hypothetical protein